MHLARVITGFTRDRNSKEPGEDSRSAREKSARQPAKSMAAVGVLTRELNLTTTGPQHP